MSSDSWPPQGPGPLCELLLLWIQACAQLAQRLGQGAPPPDLAGEKHHGDTSLPWDLEAQALFCQALLPHPALAALVSEERTEPWLAHPQGDYIAALDPLDGSDNLELCAGVGSFLTLLAVDPQPPSGPGADTPPCLLLPQGHQVRAAALAVLGVRLDVFLRIDGHVQHWRWCPESGAPRRIQAPVLAPPGRSWMVNLGHFPHWPAPWRQRFLAQLPNINQGKQRVHGALVLDVARLLLLGGCALSLKLDALGPRLRLLYELFPAAYLLEGAGAQALCDTGRLLDQPLTRWHQTCEAYLGNPEALAPWLSDGEPESNRLND